MATQDPRKHLAKSDILIEEVRPSVENGRYPAKGVAGELFDVSADVIRHGHDELHAVLRYRGVEDTDWSESPMEKTAGDRWVGAFLLTELGRYRYTIQAWYDPFATWRRDLAIKVDAGLDVSLELIEGAELIKSALDRAAPAKRAALKEMVAKLSDAGDGGATRAEDSRVQTGLDPQLFATMLELSERRRGAIFDPSLEVVATRERARSGAWYEFFPRSTGKNGSYGTFKTAAEILPAIAEMGFDVVYLPPIHPIGHTNRKGKNNSLSAGPEDVGSPWAIGSEDGGHDAVHPALGTIEDFDSFVAEAAANGLEVALDFAIQCSPDHPWVKEHPEWFHHRPDGTIKYAENPPKKYQDVYPLNFDAPDPQALWIELKRIVDHWIDHGVKIFRVDNPHTKPLPFWEWLISAVQVHHPEVVFLAEAFTEAPLMKALSKLGFTQSYTFFTWKNTKDELTDYMEELTRPEMAAYFRPNFFANTPDILHPYLQKGGPPAFKSRLVLAATLSPAYGIYSGFEFCENVPESEGSEEYLNSEKFELKARPIGSSEGIADYVRRVNSIRRASSAFRILTNIEFVETSNDEVIAYRKSWKEDLFLIAVNLDPRSAQTATLPALYPDGSQASFLRDLLEGSEEPSVRDAFTITLDPISPARIFAVKDQG
ncbi:MAG: alpha-1,4-glucan--maltose-1-phosphate maltosyltransferase [Actinomycetota bacterium]|nr:alpha-1,4-glucan--maltose-1-phosphate maltosyltransferase [Actinomycetota bacterium]